MRAHLRAGLDELRKRNLRGEVIKGSHGHARLAWAMPDGRSRCVIVSCSPAKPEQAAKRVVRDIARAIGDTQ